MEKNTNMPNANDELCLKYVLNELDPSEIMLVERAMAEDDDTLIEVESMRATLRKLERLPEHEPPKHVQQKILQQAREHADYRYHSSRVIKLFSLPASASYTAAALAAVLIISLSYGVYQYSAEFQQSSTAAPDAAGEIFTPAGVSQTNTATDFSYEQPESRPSATTSTQLQQLPENTAAAVKPWIDENRILHLRIRSGQPSYSILGNAASNLSLDINPLIPLYDYSGSNKAAVQENTPSTPDIQLTNGANMR
ncbi:MAG: anti-sigma factor family protein [Cyclonatronaceae bacterium]